jgi:hypothetical protein
MSIQGSAGAQTAAEDIAAFVRKQIEAAKQYRSGSAVFHLEVVLKFAEELRDSAKSGWY